MSLWIESPTIVHLGTDKALLCFRDANWSLDSAKWVDESTVLMELRKYPGNHTPPSLAVTIDCAAGTGTVGSAMIETLSELEEQLDNSLQWLSDDRAVGSVGWRKWIAGLLGR